MKLINLNKWTGSYSEISQQNPIRWMNIRPVDSDTYEPVSHWWKCKDFMNEVVTSYHLRKKFSIYGFTVDPETFFSDDQKELYFLVKNITPAWEENMLVVNDFLLSEGFPAVQYKKLEEYYWLCIPEIYLYNTFFISAVTLLIRMANVSTVYQTMEELVKDSGNTQDLENYQALVKKPLSEFPFELEEYIWYYDKNNNLKHWDFESTIMTSNMHNCGVVNWGWV